MNNDAITDESEQGKLKMQDDNESGGENYIAIKGKQITAEWLQSVGFELNDEGVWVLDSETEVSLCATHPGPPQTYLMTIENRVLWDFDIQTIGQVVLIIRWTCGYEIGKASKHEETEKPADTRHCEQL